MSRISDFLNIKLNNQKNPDTLGVENQLHHQNLKKPYSSTASIGKWKNELSDETLKLIIKESAENLKDSIIENVFFLYVFSIFFSLFYDVDA